MKMTRIQVNGRRFGWKAGNTFIGIKEYRVPGQEGALISFAEALPDEITRGNLRAMILRHINVQENHEQRPKRTQSIPGYPSEIKREESQNRTGDQIQAVCPQFIMEYLQKTEG